MLEVRGIQSPVMDLIVLVSVAYQVTLGHGNPQKGGQCLAVMYSNIVALNTRFFTRYVRRHPTKKINTKKLPENFLDASETHKASANMSVQIYFRQFPDW